MLNDVLIEKNLEYVSVQSSGTKTRMSMVNSHVQNVVPNA